MKRILIFLIEAYQRISKSLEKQGFIKKHCVFYPSCSEYGIEALKKHGSIKGISLICRRILRCHPWQKKTIDPIN